MSGTPPTSSSVIVWPNRLLSADDLRRHLTSQRELVLLPKTVITPLAADELKAKGVRVTWQAGGAVDPKRDNKGAWIYALEGSESIVKAVIAALERDGVMLSALNGDARMLAETVLRDRHVGGILFAADSALACCIANKIAGIRAASVLNVMQVTRAKKTLAANWFAIEVPGRTFFELRQMVKAIVANSGSCPEGIARILQELDGHAHR